MGTVAVNMILAQPNRFEVIIIFIELRDLNITTFMNTIRKGEIPIINKLIQNFIIHFNFKIFLFYFYDHAVMSSETKTKVALKALDNGACFYLEKPVSSEDARQVWQHAMRKRRSNETTPGARPTSRVHRENKEEISGKGVLEVVKINEGAGVSTARKEVVNVDPNDPNGKKKAEDQGENGNGVEENQANMEPLGMSQGGQNTPVSNRKEPNAGAENENNGRLLPQRMLAVMRMKRVVRRTGARTVLKSNVWFGSKTYI